MEGGTFTITQFGRDSAARVLAHRNHPEVAILGLSRSRMEPEWVNNKFEAALDSSAVALVRSPVDRWRGCRALSAVDREAFEQPFLLSVQDKGFHRRDAESAEFSFCSCFLRSLGVSAVRGFANFED